MLVEFSVTNFRSIHERQTLSLVAAAGREHRETNVFDSGAPATPELVRSAVMYGPNASGKSNVLLALGFMRQLVVISGQLVPDVPLNIPAFAFAELASAMPTEFDIVFVHEGVRYQYGFSVSKDRIHGEWLYAWPEGKQQRWFERSWNAELEKTEWHFGSKLSGPKKVWQQSTRDAALLLTIAVQLNAEALKPPFDWIFGFVKPVIPYARFTPNFSIEQCQADASWKQRVVDFLAATDSGITDVHIEKKKVDRPSPSPTADPALPPMVQIMIGPQEVYDVRFSHKAEDGRESRFSLTDESGGTQKLFAMVGPWLDVLEHGYVLVVDELDTSLHPLLIRRLIAMFHDPAINAKGAQLIFSTHDTSILDGDLFRRDQIWFVEKDRALSTHLYSLTDFSPRKEENIARGYLHGRYGALPFVGELRI
jgi:AAA15 family ATPase/GTPase